LGLLPTNTPVALTYGNLPKTARIVVSEGLLAQLADDEIATLFAGQVGHIVHWDFVLMSLGVLVLQVPYTIYWQVAQWGEQLETKFSSSRLILRLLTGLTGLIASISYGIYWLLRLPLLWFSRARVYYSDRLAVETTGNPNGMTRALLKTALGITEDIETLGKTSGLLESFDLLLPVGYQQAIPLSRYSSQASFEKLLNWDCTNRYRDWLIVSASHPLIGERLAMLARCAQFWKLETELDLPSLTPPIRTNAARLSKLGNSHKALPLLQSCLLFGLVLGLILRGLLWLIGKIGDVLNIWQLIWMYNATPFLNACILVAFSLSVFLWINGYFPDIKPSTVQTEPDLGDLFANPATLPPDSQPVQITGKLLGRRNLLNWLAQDLILQTPTGLVKLHFFSFLGPFGNVLPLPIRPSNLIEQQVTVSGWFRRGVTPWIDIESLRSQSGRVARANYPIWVTLLALAAAVLGAYLIWQA
jgi:Zn-dependent protease with chaperone function